MYAQNFPGLSLEWAPHVGGGVEGAWRKRRSTPPPIRAGAGTDYERQENLHCEHGSQITSRRLRLRNCKIRPGRTARSMRR